MNKFEKQPRTINRRPFLKGGVLITEGIIIGATGSVDYIRWANQISKEQKRIFPNVKAVKTCSAGANRAGIECTYDYIVENQDKTVSPQTENEKRQIIKNYKNYAIQNVQNTGGIGRFLYDMSSIAIGVSALVNGLMHLFTQEEKAQ